MLDTLDAGEPLQAVETGTDRPAKYTLAITNLLLDTRESLKAPKTGIDRLTEYTSRQNPLMAPEFALLGDVGMPLNVHSLPNFRLEGDKVVISIVTHDSVNSPKYQTAITCLEARGCKVGIDMESSECCVYIQITAPRSLFSPDAIAALEAKQNAERIMYEQAARAGAAVRTSLMPDWGC